MHFLYGLKQNQPRRLVATFGSEAQLRAYVRWATLQESAPQAGKYEQGSALAGFVGWENSPEPLTDEDLAGVVHNPSPNML